MRVPADIQVVDVNVLDHIVRIDDESRAQGNAFLGADAEAVDEGSLRADLPPEVVSRLVFGTVNSLVDWYAPDGPIAPDALGDAVCRLLFEGLLA